MFDYDDSNPIAHAKASKEMNGQEGQEEDDDDLTNSVLTSTTAIASILRQLGYSNSQSAYAPERDREFFEYLFRDTSVCIVEYICTQHICLPMFVYSLQ